MAVTKSPKYPNFSLRQALTQVEKVFKEDRRNPIDRAVAAKHMGYSGLSGASDKALGTMVQYGLFELTGKGELKVSQLAVDILHPDSPAQHKAALSRAAYSPPLFKALKDRFPDGVSAEALRSYLVRENFLDRAINPIITAFTDTCAFLKQEGAFESDGIAESGGSESDLEEFEETPMEDANTIIRRTPPPPPPPHFPAGPDIPVGMRKFVINLPNGGDAILAYPDDLTAEGYQDLEDYLTLFFKKAKRAAPTPSDGSDLV